MKGSLKRSRNQHSDKKRGKTNVDLSEKKVVAFDDEEEEIERLNKRIVDEAPASGTQPRSDGKLRFDSLPISRRTLFGLQSAKLEIATEIQAAAIPHALSGRDILGAAKTGSGKTLSFVIPMLEKLFRERWTSEDGLAAIIISPTRELAFQIFEVLRQVGKKHLFSAGLITGGKKEFAGEQERIVRMNILVATPGRLLQHFEQTSGFDASQLQLLILDEADRILDMGFKTQLDSILNYLPSDRQTFLFSATQTKSIKDLARLSLNHPEYIAVHANDDEVTPKQLIQNYILVPLHHKLDILYSFIKTHLKSKMIIFFSTCAQVRYIYECFSSMQPGIVLLSLHGKVKQEKRTIIYNDFLKRSSACMLATDIAARGLDFPNVDWVVQADAPEDAAMYIHRVGRTARYNSNGRALLMLMPHEEEPVSKVLKDALVPIKKLSVNPKRTFSVSASAAALLAAHPDYRNYAKKAFVGYLRSLQLLSSYPIKDIKSLPVDEYATALGLPMTPELPIVETKVIDDAREEIRSKKNVNRALDKLKKQIQEAKEAKRKKREERLSEKMKNKSGDDSDSDLSSSDDDDSDGTMTDGSSDEDEKKKANSKAKKHSVHQMRMDIEKKREAMADEDDDEDDFLAVKQVHRWADEPIEESKEKNEDVLPGKKAEKKDKPLKITKDGKAKNVPSTAKVVFDDEGNIVDHRPNLVPIQEKEKSEIEKRVEKHATELKQKIDQIREEDHLRDKQRIREKKLQRKQQLKQQKDEDNTDFGPVATLENAIEEEEYEANDEDHSDNSDDDGDDRMSEDESSNERDEDESDSISNDGSENDNEDDEEENIPRKKQKKNDLSIADQEKLVMQILNNKK